MVRVHLNGLIQADVVSSIQATLLYLTAALLCRASNKCGEDILISQIPSAHNLAE